MYISFLRNIKSRAKTGKLSVLFFYFCRILRLTAATEDPFELRRSLIAKTTFNTAHFAREIAVIINIIPSKSHRVKCSYENLVADGNC